MRDILQIPRKGSFVKERRFLRPVIGCRYLLKKLFDISKDFQAING